ncbi:mono-functional DNA-alkylating methyl methanesulfonate N-term-domain-containing protein [Flagelloscypha sp. PMI_526]|nr:mono-functional DNA-alkylating methyl methanesulfonate N-term-domain-containing protein [Flagelloscypha sp. PMI_526]
MRLVSTFHPPSVVLHSLKCKLDDSENEYFVTAGPSHIDVYALSETGLIHHTGLDVWGSIQRIVAVPISDEADGKAKLLVLLGHPEPELLLLDFNHASNLLSLSSQISLFQRGQQVSEFLTDVLVHPNGSYAVAHVYQGKLLVVTLENGEFGQDRDIQIDSNIVLAMTLIPSSSTDIAIALLRMDREEAIQLYGLNINFDEIETTHSALFAPTTIPSFHDADHPPHLVCVPKLVNPEHMEVDGDDDENIASSASVFRGGILVLGGDKVYLYEFRKSGSIQRNEAKLGQMEADKTASDSPVARKAFEKERAMFGRKRKPEYSVEWPWSFVSAWADIPGDPMTYLLGDAFGRIAMLSLKQLEKHGLLVIPVGQTSQPTTLTYLGTKTFYLGSRCGDSMLIRLTTSPRPDLPDTDDTLPIPDGLQRVTTLEAMDPTDDKKGKRRRTDSVELNPQKGCIIRTKGSYLRVLETFKNIAPIFDAILVDLDGSNIHQLVTCSGSANTGSLNLVRTGAEFQELASLNLEDFGHLSGIFPIVASSTSQDNLLLISTFSETLALKIQDANTFQHITSLAIVTSTPTIAAGNIGWEGKPAESVYFVQVTSKQVTLIEVDTFLNEYRETSKWVSPSFGGKATEIVTATITETEVLVALNDSRVLSLSVGQNGNFAQSNKFLDVQPQKMEEPSAMAATSNRQYYAVATWQSNTIDIFKGQTTAVDRIASTPPLSSPICSLLFFTFNGDPAPTFLIAGLANGTIAYFPWVRETLGDMKIVSLGDAPVSLSPCTVEGNPVVFASGSRSMVMSWHKKRVKTAPIMLKDVATATALDSDVYGKALVLASAGKVTIGSVKNSDSLHIRSIPLGSKNPRRIAHSKELKAFAVICREETPVRSFEEVQATSTVQLFDDTSFRLITTYTAPSNEELVSLSFFNLSGFGTLLAAGSYEIREDEYDASHGTIRLFGISDIHSNAHAQMNLATSIDVPGCPWALQAVKKDLIATVAGAVMSFNVEHTIEGTVSISTVSKWNHNTLLRHLDAVDDTIVVGDIISSVSMLKSKDGILETITRHYRPLWPLAVGMSDKENVLACDDRRNLVAFQLNTKQQLEYNGSYHLGDFVSAILRGSLASSDTAQMAGLRPTQVFAAASGLIGIISEFDEGQLDVLYKLQRNLALTADAVGGTSHTHYRSPVDSHGRTDAEEEATGFLDADFIEKGLDIVLRDEKERETMLHREDEALALEMTEGELQDVYELLQSLH